MFRPSTQYLQRFPAVQISVPALQQAGISGCGAGSVPVLCQIAFQARITRDNLVQSPETAAQRDPPLLHNCTHLYWLWSVRGNSDIYIHRINFSSFICCYSSVVLTVAVGGNSGSVHTVHCTGSTLYNINESVWSVRIVFINALWVTALSHQWPIAHSWGSSCNCNGLKYLELKATYSFKILMASSIAYLVFWVLFLHHYHVNKTRPVVPTCQRCSHVSAWCLKAEWPVWLCGSGAGGGGCGIYRWGREGGLTLPTHQYCYTAPPHPATPPPRHSVIHTALHTCHAKYHSLCSIFPQF